MESKIAFVHPKSVLTPVNAVRTATLATAPLLLSVTTTGRLVPLALLTTFIGLAMVSIRKSAAEGNRSTTENIVIASLLIAAAVMWGSFIAGPLFLVVPLLAAIITRRATKRPVDGPVATEPVLVRH